MYHMIPAFEFRRRARAAMKSVMPILLVVAMIASLPSLLNSTVTIIADADPNSLITDYTNRLMQVLEAHGLNQSAVVGDIVIDEAQLAADILTALDQYVQYAMTFLQEKGLLIALLFLMVLVCSPVLTLGLINALLHALRRQPFTPSIALSRVRYIFKALGLELLFGLKIFLWMLPGTAVALASMFLPQRVAALAMIGGMIASIVMGVMAAYRYAMVTFILADQPATRIRDCFRRSCEVMHRRKLELFGLELSFIGWNLLLSMVQTMLLSFGMVIGLTLGMFASLFLTVYTKCAEAAFYQEYVVGPVTEKVADEAADQEELN